jgi:diacylglycerol kinase family enzyme
MDVGQCHNGKHFLLWAGVGVDSRIVEAVEPRSRLLKRFGLPGYILKATPAFLMFRGARTRITAGATTVEGDFFMVTVCNSRLFSGGMFNLNRDGVLDDGELEVWAFPGRYPPRMIWHSLFMAANYHAHRPDVILLRGRHVILETATPQPFHLDGELNRATPMICSVLPGALRVLAPDTAPADIFQHPGTRLTAG